MACRRMNPKDIGPSLLTAVDVMKEMSDGVGGWEENKESEAEMSTETVWRRVVEVKEGRDVHVTQEGAPAFNVTERLLRTGASDLVISQAHSIRIKFCFIIVRSYGL